MKRFTRCLLLVISILCGIVTSACNAYNTVETGDTNTDFSVESEKMVNSSHEMVVVRFPLLDETNTYDYNEYYNSGLNYPEANYVIDNSKLNSKQSYSIQGDFYSANYSSTVLYSADLSSDFLNEKKYDIYSTDENVEIQVFANSGALKKLFFYEAGLNNSPNLLNDCSESSLITAAQNVLVDLYGSSITNYLGSYYRYEYARLITYQNEEQNRYVVCYRAYINEIPTDDVIYIQFSPTGKLWSVSAQRYTQYMNVNTDNLIPVNKLQEQIIVFLDKLDYSNISLRQKEPSCYYSMNMYGELYYVSEWEAFKAFSDNTGVTRVEVLAIKANED